MNQMKKIIALYVCIYVCSMPTLSLKADMLDIFDKSGDLTNLGLVGCALGGCAGAALGYDIYKTLYIPQKDREHTFVENSYQAVSDVSKHLQSTNGIKDCMHVGFNLLYGAVATYIGMHVSKLFYADGMNLTVLHPGDIKATFDDVAGLDDAKLAMKDIIDYFKNPQVYEQMGVPAPKGLLMYGGPGNGKTLLAKALAGQTNCSFISTTGSSFVEKYVGAGAQRVRELFALARKQGPCIIFIDEIDSFLAKRESGHSEQNQTVAAFLAEVDGLQQNRYPIIVIGATNRIDDIDRPAIRPGRFDRHIEITKPKTSDRKKLLQINLDKIQHHDDIDFSLLADMTSGFSGADLTNLVNQSALIAIQLHEPKVSMQHIKTAFDQIKSSMMTTIDASYQLDIAYPGDIKVTFDDVAGLSGAKAEVREIIDYLQNSTLYDQRGIKISKGILLDGPPGNGKTSLARAIAGQANCPFISVSGSSFVEKYVGTGAARVRELFEKARKEAPCIIFIDEIDALLFKRLDSDCGGTTEYNQTIAEFLKQVDGIKNDNKPIIMIGATNRLQALDEAAVRPGRFDYKVHVPNPSLKDRMEILAIKSRDLMIDDHIDFSQIAYMTEGFSGADLTHLVNQAARLAMKDNVEKISLNHLQRAIEEKHCGEKLSSYMSDRDRRIAAYRKSGRAIALLQEGKHLVTKVSIEPYSHSSGLVNAMPVTESFMHPWIASQHDIKMLLCEQLAARECQDDHGLSTDFSQARLIARSMIQKYGIPDKFAREGKRLKSSDEVIEDIVHQEYLSADAIVKNNKKNIEQLAHTLLIKNTLSGQELYQMFHKPLPDITVKKS